MTAKEGTGDMTTAYGEVHHVGLTVKDIDRSLAFYEKMFGVTPLFVNSASGDELSTSLGVPDAKLRFAFLQFGDGVVELLSYDNPRKESFTRRNCDVGSAHVCIHVDDIRSAYEELKEKDAEFFSEPLRIDGGPLDGCSFVYLRDPDGITLELFETAKKSPAGENHVA